MASRIFEFRVIGFDSVFHLYKCTKELVLSTKKRRTMLRTAAVLPVFALKKNFEFGWKPPVHILDINAVSVGTLQPAGLEASKAVISVNCEDPLDPSWQDDPGTKKYFASWQSAMRTATKPAIGQNW